MGLLIEYESGFANWGEAVGASSGYDKPDILGKVLAASLAVKRGEAAFERDSVLFRELEVHWPTIAALAWAAARNQGRLSVLDFGGALGSSYYQCRSFLSRLRAVQWSVVEQAHFVAAGKSQLEDGILKFHDSIEQSVQFGSPNIVLLSSVLQYVENPVQLLAQLGATEADLLLISRTPISTQATNQVLVQRVPASICLSSYPMWSISESWLKGVLHQDWVLVADGLSAEGAVRAKGGAEFVFKDMLFERKL